MPFIPLSGHVPDTLGEVVEYSFNPGNVLGDFGFLSYMIDTQGGSGYGIDLVFRGTGTEQRMKAISISLPPVRLYTSLITVIPLRDNLPNRVQFVRSEADHL